MNSLKIVDFLMIFNVLIIFDVRMENSMPENFFGFWMQGNYGLYSNAQILNLLTKKTLCSDIVELLFNSFGKIHELWGHNATVI